MMRLTMVRGTCSRVDEASSGMDTQAYAMMAKRAGALKPCVKRIPANPAAMTNRSRATSRELMTSLSPIWG